MFRRRQAGKRRRGRLRPTERNKPAMKVVYSPRFKRQYDELPPTSKAQFQLIDGQVKAGNLGVLRQNDWVYYIGVGGGLIAWGTTASNEFYWRAVGPPAIVPV